MRVNFNLPDELVKDLDDYSKTLNLNRTATVTMLLTQQLQIVKAADTVEILKRAFQKLENAEVKERD